MLLEHYGPTPAAEPPPAQGLSLVQAGPQAVDVESSGFTVFLPSRFDPARPFTVRVRLAAGEHRLGTRLLVGLPRAP